MSMSEADWLACTTPRPMLDYLRDRVCDRKLRVFACACWDRLSTQTVIPPVWKIIESASQDMEGLRNGTILIHDLRAVLGRLTLVETPFSLLQGSDLTRNFLLWSARRVDGVLALSRLTEPEQRGTREESEIVTAFQAARESTFNLIRELSDFLDWLALASPPPETEDQAQADILRHIIGNPFRPYPVPAHWPVAVVHLADAMYAGQDCHHFALCDALLDAGHDELAEHFREPGHPKGCWALDLLLGKE